MITSFFKKSTPLNYSFLIIVVFLFFILCQIQLQTAFFSGIVYLEKMTILGVIFATLFILNFIVKRNGLSKDSVYTILFYIILLLFFPTAWDNLKLLVSNFFILLALRRLISLQSLKAPREKIFDASLWIFVASLFYFWCILYIILVFIAILFHVSRDYRSWFLPFIAFFTVTIIFIFATLLFKTDWISYFIQNSSVSYNFDYFKNNYENLSFSIYVTVALFFFFTMIFTLSSRPLILQAIYKEIVFSFLIGVAIMVLSPFKSNDLLVFTFAPLSIMATNYIEIPQSKWNKEVVLLVLIASGLFCFFVQL